MVMYVLLYLKWITNRDLLYSTWNFAQYYVAVWMEGRFGGEWDGHVYIAIFKMDNQLARTVKHMELCSMDWRRG